MEAFIIKEKIYEMIRYGSPALLHFPKVERYELAGQRNNNAGFIHTAHSVIQRRIATLQ